MLRHPDVFLLLYIYTLKHCTLYKCYGSKFVPGLRPEANQGLLELLWMVYSEGKLQSRLKLGILIRISQKVYETYHAQKKRPKICTRCRVNEAKFNLYHSTKIFKAWPGFDEIP